MQKGALTTAEVCEALGLGQLKNRSWHVQGAISIRGEGLYEGLDWYAASPAVSLCCQHSAAEHGLSMFCCVQACQHIEEHATVWTSHQCHCSRPMMATVMASLNLM